MIDIPTYIFMLSLVFYPEPEDFVICIDDYDIILCEDRREFLLGCERLFNYVECPILMEI